MKQVKVIGQVAALLLLCWLAGCRTQIEQSTPSNDVMLPLTAALMNRSDLSDDWQWYSEQDAPTTKNPVTQTQTLPIEVTSRAFQGYWQTRKNDILVGHVLKRYVQQTPILPEITPADLLDYPKTSFYSPDLIKVGKSQRAECAPSPGTEVYPPVFACKVIVQYDHILSIVQVTSPISVREQVVALINQILGATDSRIQQIAPNGNP